jgi:hypothetical protein
MGEVTDQFQVVQPALLCLPSSTPLLIASSPSGAVIAMW